ncbi:hypothetical protein VaNZ11_002466 [Volvox africanus]|uniref:LITAF domain-containing protein n=1 Tax=Volvox africanus TaxID=51714 RepID=A0ABQ5RRX3_9CHLO|nr:hypothetical protein VaNZ11_002466 [Volvox africanus]
MGESLKAPLVPKEGFEGASAPPAPNQFSTGTSSDAGTSTATGYPVTSPEPSAYPPIPATSLGTHAQHYLAPAPSHPPVLIAAPQHVVLCHHQYDHLGQVCDRCHRFVTPEPSKEMGLFSFLFAVGLCAVGCWPCAWVPLCCDCARDTVYRCPVCGAEMRRRVP